MEQTRYKYAMPSDQQKGMPQPPLQAPYSGTPIDLPAPAEIQVQTIDLRSAIEERQSLRRYAEAPLSLAELSFLLWCTQGVKGTRDTYATLGNQPKLLIWGSADPEIPKSHIEQLRDTMNNLTYVEIEGAGHGVAVERQDEVNRTLVDFLGRQ